MLAGTIVPSKWTFVGASFQQLATKAPAAECAHVLHVFISVPIDPAQSHVSAHSLSPHPVGVSWAPSLPEAVLQSASG